MTKLLLPHRLMLGIIVLGGLLFRVAFLLAGSKVYYAGQQSIYLNGDSGSYMWAFENLLHYGHYSFDFLEPEASFGRLPGYPFFYGLHYLIFGPDRAIMATVWTQTLLDSAAVLLMFGIIRQLTPRSVVSALLGAALYAAYPFIIIWVSIIGTEALATDLALLWLWLLLRYRPSVGYSLGLGVVLAVCFFVREYLGVLTPISFLYLALRYRRALLSPGMGAAGPVLRGLVLVGVGFGLLYLGWPLRNYVSHNRFMLTKTKTAGYSNYTPDVDSYYQWVHAWTYDENIWLDQMLPAPTVTFPAEVFADAAEQAEAQRLVALARSCGSGFYVRRTAINTDPMYRDTAAILRNPEFRRFRFHNCNQEISAGFQKLERSYAQRHPWSYRFAVPGQNLRKAFFKSDTNASRNAPVTAKTWLLRILFGYRTLLVLLGMLGVVLYRQLHFLPIGLFVAFMYLFISFYMRGLEMRYLLQADVLLLPPAALLLGHFLERLLPASWRRVEPATA